MFEDVFEELPWHLEEQSEQAIRERAIKWPSEPRRGPVTLHDAPARMT
jgi:2-oxoisovalerate dehydrogenase E1 component alpha subunit